MIPSLLIAFRETLEAALVVGIAHGYLTRTGQGRYRGAVNWGVGIGVLASIVGAYLFRILAGGFEGRAEELFEGVTMLVGAALLTTMILWMRNQRDAVRELETRVATEVSRARSFGLFALVLVAVLREGIETVIFLGAASLSSSENNLVGALLGIAGALALGYALFSGSRRISMRAFFSVTGVLLILFAAGLVSQGLHELEEARVLSPIVEHVWDINPPVNTDGSFPILHENGSLGSVFKALLGYDGNPSLLQVIGYCAYLVVTAVGWRLGSSRPTV